MVIPPVDRQVIMLFEMVCSCGATLHLDVEKTKEEAAWLLVNRFTTAHVSCGFMTPLLEEMPSTKKIIDIPIKDRDIT